MFRACSKCCQYQQNGFGYHLQNTASKKAKLGQIRNLEASVLLFWWQLSVAGPTDESEARIYHSVTGKCGMDVGKWIPKKNCVL